MYVYLNRVYTHKTRSSAVNAAVISTRNNFARSRVGRRAAQTQMRDSVAAVRSRGLQRAIIIYGMNIPPHICMLEGGGHWKWRPTQDMISIFRLYMQSSLHHHHTLITVDRYTFYYNLLLKIINLQNV